ncbi:hypothetical protein CsSME_00014456 [Camellia sinensis var. sinensis]
MFNCANRGIQEQNSGLFGGKGAWGWSSESQIEKISSFLEPILSEDDVKTSSTEEAVSRHSKSKSEDDDAGLGSGSEEDAETGSKSGSGDGDAGFGSKSHSCDDSGADGDSAPKSFPRKRAKRASRA